MCDAHLHDGDLVCIREDEHGDRGHVYRSSTGSDVNDTHLEGGHG